MLLVVVMVVTAKQIVLQTFSWNNLVYYFEASSDYTAIRRERQVDICSFERYYDRNMGHRTTHCLGIVCTVVSFYLYTLQIIRYSLLSVSQWNENPHHMTITNCLTFNKCVGSPYTRAELYVGRVECSHWWVKVSIPTGRTDRQRDRQTPERYIR